MRLPLLISFLSTALAAALGIYILLHQPAVASFDDTIQLCLKSTGIEQKNCVANAAKLLADYDIEEQSVIIDRALSTPEFGGICHMMAHELGAALFAKSTSLPEALAYCTEACSSGCYHGAAEAYLLDRLAQGKDSSEESLLAELEGVNACIETSDPTCATKMSHAAHGLGHALMFVLGNDLPEVLRLCDTLGNAEACHIGAFMSNYLSLDDATHPSLFIRRDDPLYPCLILDDRYAAACYGNQADFFLGEDVAANVELCRVFPEAHQEECFKRVANKHIQKINDPDVLAHVCDVVPGDNPRKLCIENIVKRLGDSRAEPHTTIERFCEALDSDFNSFCLDLANQVL
jgi:hypothetical protein